MGSVVDWLLMVKKYRIILTVDVLHFVTVASRLLNLNTIWACNSFSF